jgi:hypothetical protein
MRTFLVGALGLAAAAAAAIVLNLVLLGYTSPPGEPVGKLSPAIPLKVAPKPAPLPPRIRGERDD